MQTEEVDIFEQLFLSLCMGIMRGFIQIEFQGDIPEWNDLVAKPNMPVMNLPEEFDKFPEQGMLNPVGSYFVMPESFNSLAFFQHDSFFYP
jgi:hypothetical protein